MKQRSSSAPRSASSRWSAIEIDCEGNSGWVTTTSGIVSPLRFPTTTPEVPVVVKRFVTTCVANDAALVDQKKRRQARNPVGLARIAGFVDDHAVTHLVSFGEDGGFLGRVGGDAHDREALGTEAVFQRRQARREHPARATPARPKIQDHDAPLAVGQLELGAVQQVEVDGGGGLPDQR